jgi:SanA protein
MYLVQRADDAIVADAKDAQTMQVALVLGARVYSPDKVSPILEDRLNAAAELFTLGKVSKFIVSGDHGREEYNEVRAMKNKLLEAGVPEEDIFMDHAGFDTYDSVYRAKHIFGAESVIIVSQRFHLPRALFIADALGLPAIGLASDACNYGRTFAWRVAWREPLARFKALGSVLLHAQPTYLGETISLAENGQVTDDEKDIN